MAGLNERRCLSIQSHVVHGYVGNKSATFPLQLLGFDVDTLNSVQLSCHTGYRTFRGQVLDGEQLQAILDGLEENGLMAYSHVLTGYVSSATFLRKIATAVQTARRFNPGAVYVCDPVMGDHGKLYVPPDLVPIYRELVAPLATILTPNQFECEQLSERRITDEASAFAAMEVLHARGTRAVILTSSALPAGQDDVMLLLASCPWEMVRDEWDTVFAGVPRPATASGTAHAGSATEASEPAAGATSAAATSAAAGPISGAGAAAEAAPSKFARFSITIPKLHSVFTGSGDLTAALLLAHATETPRALASACEKTIATVQAVCRRTMAHYNDCTVALEAERAKATDAAGASAAGAAGADAAGSSEGAAAAAAVPYAAAAKASAEHAPSWLSLAAGSTSGQMGAIIPAFNELRIVQSKRDIECPPDTSGFRARAVAS